MVVALIAGLTILHMAITTNYKVGWIDGPLLLILAVIEFIRIRFGTESNHSDLLHLKGSFLVIVIVYWLVRNRNKQPS